MHQHDVGRAHDAGNRNDIGEEIEIEPVVERCVDRVRRTGQKERITVRGRSYDRLGADIGAGSWSVLYDECLAESLGQPLSYQTRHDVGGAARASADDDAHRLGRIIERRSASDTRNDETCDGECKATCEPWAG